MQFAFERDSVPDVVCISEATDVIEKTTEIRRTIRIGERIGIWTFMATVELHDHRRFVVFENLTTPIGSIVYADTGGIVLTLSKTLEPTMGDEAACYSGFSKSEIVDGKRDLLAEAILSHEGEPSFEQISACLPPIGNTAHSRTFVGSPEALYPVPIFYSGRTRRFNPIALIPEIDEPIAKQRVMDGIVGAWLPTVHLWHSLSEDAGWDMVIFGTAEQKVEFLQPVLHRLLRIENGVVSEAHYIDTFPPYPTGRELNPDDFYRQLFELHAYWSGRFAAAMRVELPEAWIPDFSLHSLALEMISHHGAHCRYGIVTQDGKCYGVPECNGFQDTLTAGVNAFLEWGAFDVAELYLDSYLENYIAEDGSVRMRGAEIAQYGRMLTVIAQYFEYTRDTDLLRRHDSKVRAIVEILMARRRRAEERPTDDPAYGMIAGWDESDIYGRKDAMVMYDLPYLSNSAEAWRGFRDLGRVWTRLGGEIGDHALAERGRALLAEADALSRDVITALKQSVLMETDPPCLPLIAGSSTPFDTVAWRGSPESFDQSRTYSELMHSGIVPREIVEIILSYCSSHTGTRFGIFSDGHRIPHEEVECIEVLGFRVYGEAYGLIQHDMIREFLLFYYAHIAHLHTRGTWTAFESVDLDMDRGWHAPYCGPAQLTIPTLTKWMLVFEDPLDDVLWLAKATPRAYLENGKHISVAGVPTRWGRVSYTIESRIMQREVEAVMEYPRTKECRTVLRLRVPSSARLQSVTIDGKPWNRFDSGKETVELPHDGIGSVTVVAQFDDGGL